MTLSQLARKLRLAADTLDDLFNALPANETPAVARKIRAELGRKHWTQTLEGKRKMAKVQKRAWRVRKAAERKDA